MEIDNGKSQSATRELRRRAETQLNSQTQKAQRTRTEEDTQRLVHELEVHQIELEMQNAELRQSRDEIERALEKYTDLYDFAPVGYFTLDRNGTIRTMNLTGADLLGVERSKLLGKRLGQFVANGGRPVFTAFLEKVFTSSDKEACEVALLKEGKHPLFVQIDAIASASGQECRVAIIDISARRQLEEKLEIMHADLAARAVELEAFNYTVSHDLRGPLTNIHGYCQVLQVLCSDQLDEPAKRYIQDIYEGTLRMNQLIGSLLNFSRVTHVEMRWETFDLSAMAKAVAAEIKQTAPERQVTFRIAEGIKGHGDAALWRIVMDNLIRNAWKYTASRDESVIEFGVKELEGKPVCFVRDNGPGFDMANAGKLFIPFQRIHGIEIEGYGIGLATVERIVKRHGGRVWAESKPGNGATFFFTME